MVLLVNARMLLLTCFSFCSLFYVETADRPGLLVDLVKIITDINIAVESGEFDTEVYTYHSQNVQVYSSSPNHSFEDRMYQSKYQGKNENK